MFSTQVVAEGSSALLDFLNSIGSLDEAKKVLAELKAQAALADNEKKVAGAARAEAQKLRQDAEGQLTKAQEREARLAERQARIDKRDAEAGSVKADVDAKLAALAQERVDFENIRTREAAALATREADLAALAADLKRREALLEDEKFKVGQMRLDLENKIGLLKELAS